MEERLYIMKSRFHLDISVSPSSQNLIRLASTSLAPSGNWKRTIAAIESLSPASRWMAREMKLAADVREEYRLKMVVFGVVFVVLIAALLFVVSITRRRQAARTSALSRALIELQRQVAELQKEAKILCHQREVSALRVCRTCDVNTVKANPDQGTAAS